MLNLCSVDMYQISEVEGRDMNFFVMMSCFGNRAQSTPKYQYAIDEYYQMKKEEENMISEETKDNTNRISCKLIPLTDLSETLVSGSFVNLSFEIEVE
ncbi:Protein FAM177A1 [Galemys pyrenaicus]|uniref:Protein FAM177A1 n=1 Tax=Galemys pyrenaicus TaxID=202257 RepID=A0A8J6DL19_GALPY|nr:Protein FAM177A1 [Galemys pyrenaicus]